MKMEDSNHSSHFSDIDDNAIDMQSNSSTISIENNIILSSNPPSSAADMNINEQKISEMIEINDSIQQLSIPFEIKSQNAIIINDDDINFDSDQDFDIDLSDIDLDSSASEQLNGTQSLKDMANDTMLALKEIDEFENEFEIKEVFDSSLKISQNAINDELLESNDEKTESESEELHSNSSMNDDQQRIQLADDNLHSENSEKIVIIDDDEQEIAQEAIIVSNALSDIYEIEVQSLIQNEVSSVILSVVEDIKCNMNEKVMSEECNVNNSLNCNAFKSVVSSLDNLTKSNEQLSQDINRISNSIQQKQCRIQNLDKCITDQLQILKSLEIVCKQLFTK